MVGNVMSNQDWQVKSALNTLQEADRIQKDTKLMKKVGVLASKEMAALQKISSKKEDKTMAKKVKAPAAKSVNAKSSPAKAPKVVAKNAKCGKKC